MSCPFLSCPLPHRTRHKLTRHTQPGPRRRPYHRQPPPRPSGPAGLLLAEGNATQSREAGGGALLPCPALSRFPAVPRDRALAGGGSGGSAGQAPLAPVRTEWDRGFSIVRFLGWSPQRSPPLAAPGCGAGCRCALLTAGLQCRMVRVGRDLLGHLVPIPVL